MKKNALLTFLFALIPGAGQMYYGYMQRGLSLISLFSLSFGLAYTVTEMFLVFCAIVWMYSFFDVYDLLRCANAGQPRQDGLMLIGSVEELKRAIPRNGKLLGWILIGLGIYGLYELIVRDLLFPLFRMLFGDMAWGILHNIPGIVVSVLFITAGVWLLGLRPPQKAAPEPEAPPYPQAEPVPPMPDDLMPDIEPPAAPEPMATEPAAPEAVDPTEPPLE